MHKLFDVWFILSFLDNAFFSCIFYILANSKALTAKPSWLILLYLYLPQLSAESQETFESI
jgi:hypothetical protein